MASPRPRGRPIGGHREGTPDIRLHAAKGNASSAAKRTQTATERAEDLAPVLQELREAGAVSLRLLAEGLNKKGIPAPRGGAWRPMQVKR